MKQASPAGSTASDKNRVFERQPEKHPAEGQAETQPAEGQKCSSCQKPKAVFFCGSCGDPICKSCTEFIEDADFSYMKKIPPLLLQTRFCQPCYASAFLPARRLFSEIMARAKKVTIVDTPQRRPLPVLKNSRELLQVADCLDEPDTFLRLAFLAAEMGFNAVLKVKVEYKKVRVAGYQNLSWSGTGYPATLPPERV